MMGGYVLITPARNEARTIGQTIESVAAQTLAPQRWVIVSDGSTDGTDAIVRDYAGRIPFIQFLRKETEDSRNFSSKVTAFLAGYEQVGDVRYEFIGNLDADITFEPNYYERLMEKFIRFDKLGIGGGVTFDVVNDWPQRRHASLDSIGGAVQMFRRECYESVGGYMALAGGMEDSAAVYKAQSLGWECQSFADLPVMHHRPTSSAGQSIWRARFNQGRAMWTIGWSPWWITARAVYRMTEPPYVLGSLIRTAGYFCAGASRKPKSLSPELIEFIRNKQHIDLRRMIFGYRERKR